MAAVGPKGVLKENPNIGNIEKGINTGEKRKENTDVKLRKREETRTVKTDDGHRHKKQKVSQEQSGKSGQQPHEGYQHGYLCFSFPGLL